MSKLVRRAMRSHTIGRSGMRVLWALELCPLAGDTVGNERIIDLLLDAVGESGLNVGQILNRESVARVLRWLPQEYAGRVPNYRQFVRMADRLCDGGVFLQKLGRYEEELLYQIHYDGLDGIVGDNMREERKTEFAMRMKMIDMLMKRRKSKGEVAVVEEAAKASALRGISDAQLKKLSEMIEVEGEVVKDEG